VTKRQLLQPVSGTIQTHFVYTSTIGVHREVKIELQAIMVSTRHTINNERIFEDQMAMFPTLQKHMEEIRQRSKKDCQKNEERCASSNRKTKNTHVILSITLMGKSNLLVMLEVIGQAPHL